MFTAAAIASLVGSLFAVVALAAPAAAATTPTWAVAGTGGGADTGSNGDVYIYDSNYDYTVDQILTVTESPVNAGFSAPYIQSQSPGTGVTCSQTLPTYLYGDSNTGTPPSTWPQPSSTKWDCLLTVTAGDGSDSGVNGANGTTNTVTFAETDSTGTYTKTYTFMVIPPPITVVAPDTASGASESISNTTDQTYLTSNGVVEDGGAAGPSGALITGIPANKDIYTGSNATDPATSDSENLTIQASPGFFWTTNYSSGSDTEYNVSESDRNTSGQTWTTGATTTSPPTSSPTNATEAYSPFTPGADGSDLDQTCPPAPAEIDAGMPFCFEEFQASGNGPNAGQADLDFSGQAVPTTTTPTVATNASASVGQSVNITDAPGACPGTIGTAAEGGTGLFVNNYNCWYGRAADDTPVTVTVGGVPATTVTPNNTYSASSVVVTNGSNQIYTSGSNGFPTYVLGATVSGAGIPPGTTVESPLQNTAIWKTLELSNNATATSAGETLTFTGDVSGSYLNIGNNNGYASTISSTTLTSATVTGGSNQVTATTPDSGTAAKPYSGLVGGMVSGTDIPANTEVTACSGNCAGTGSGTVTLTLSNNATASPAAETLTFYPLYLNPPRLNANVTIPAGVPAGTQTMEVCEPTAPQNGYDYEFGVEDMAPSGSLSYINGNSGPTQVCGSTSIFVVAPTSTSTSVTDASNNSAWSGSEATGSSAYDTASVGGELDSVAPTGTVSYTYWNDADCGVSESAAGTSAGSNLAIGTQSSTEGPLPEGTYSFQATYSGDSNYTGSTSPCEPFSVGTASTSVATTVDDAGTNSAWSGSEATGSTAYDTSTVNGEVGGISPTGTISYTYWNDADCGVSESAAGASAGSNLAIGTQSSTEGPLGAGSYSFDATYSGDSNYTGSTSPCESFSVGTASTSVATTVDDAGTNSAWSGSEVTGSSAYDTSSLIGEAGDIAPTGTVSYTYWNDADCGVSESAAGTSAGSNLGIGTQSSTEGPLGAGSYSFDATYSGDSNYTGSTSPCESFSVGTASTSVVTTVDDAATNSAWSGSEATGSSAYDTSSLIGEAGDIAPTGTVSYTYWNDADCGVSESAAGTSAGSNLAIGTQSSTEGPLGAGSYSFQATYSGDSNYTGSTSPCESFSVGAASSSTASTPTSSIITEGSGNTDAATVTGSDPSVDPTGTVNFYECGPTASAAPCTSSSWAQFDTESLSGSANPDTVTSASFAPDAIGTWCFAAVYGGDGNYSGSSDQSTDECFTVTTSSTTSSPTSSSISLGGSNTDGATVTGSDASLDPTGTVTFYTCAESVDPCTSANWTQLGSPVGLSGSSNPDTVTSASFTPDSTGTWCFAAVYGGDGNYGGSSDQSSDECYTVTGVGSTSVSTPTSSTAALDGPNSDSLLITGDDAANNAPYPTGTVTFYTCPEAVDPCTSANWTQLGSPVTLGASNGNTNTATSSDFTNDSVGTWCFAAVYSGDSNYTGSNDSTSDECYTVAQTSTTTISKPLNSTITQSQSNIDQVTVYGNDYDSSPPAPTGTVTFYQCGPTTSPTSCATGTQVGSPINLTSAGGNEATATSAAFTPNGSPTSIGYWCFRAVYSGDGNYFSSSDDSSVDECFYVTGPVVVTSSSPLPSGTKGSPYSEQLTAAGGTAPYSWSKTGALPPGVHLTHGGLLTGTPRKSGTYTITAKVHDSTTPHHEKATKSLTVTFNP